MAGWSGLGAGQRLLQALDLSFVTLYFRQRDQLLDRLDMIAIQLDHATIGGGGFDGIALGVLQQAHQIMGIRIGRTARKQATQLGLCFGEFTSLGIIFDVFHDGDGVFRRG